MVVSEIRFPGSRVNPFERVPLKELSVLHHVLDGVCVANVLERILFQNNEIRQLSDLYAAQVLGQSDDASSINRWRLQNFPGRPLGLLPDSEYSSTTVQLQRGDVLVLLSDGLIEATGIDDEEFGLDRVKEILSGFSARPAQEIVDQLMLTNQRFVAGNLDQVDDRTILVIKVD